MKHANVFVLPLGLQLGGVTTWSIGMVHKLLDAGESAKLIRHAEVDTQVPMPVADDTEMLDCPGAPAYWAKLEDVISYIPSYATTLPATIVPNWSAGSYAACALLSLTKSHHFRTVGFAHTDELYYYKWLQYYEPIISLFVAVSEDIGVKLRELMPHRKSDIVVRPYGVEVLPNAPLELRAGTPVTLVYAGRIENKQKRSFDLVNLISHLEQRQVDYRFRIIGEGGQKAWLQSEVDSLPSEVRQKISLEGVIPHSGMQQVWQSADVCVLVSEYEGTSISMLEAMANGCIPLSTEVSGAVDVIVNGVNGFHVPIGDMSAMSQNIASLINDRKKLQKMREMAHSTIKNKYSLDGYVTWFKHLTRIAWEKPPAEWPVGRPILMPEIESGSSYQ